MYCLLHLSAAQANQFVKLDYNLTAGDRGRDTVFFELFDDKPITTANFMAYTNAGKYDGMFMHRLSHGFVMQGGGFYPQYQSEPSIPSLPWSLKSTSDVQVDLDGNPATPNPEIVSEYLVGTTRSNIRGTVAMARRANEPNSASSQWFVSYKNNSFLDQADGGNGFTVFAEVRGDGMAYYDELDVLATAQMPDKTNILNLNPDIDDNGTRDSGPFYNGSSTDAVPIRGNNLDNLVIVERASRIDYYGSTGSSSALNIPAGGYTISARDAFFDTGANITGSGALTIGVGRTLGVRNGISLNRQVNNQGTLAPGLRNAQLTVQSYQQAASGKLEIQLRGTTVDTEYDRLAVTGNAQLGGELEVQLLGDFAPAAGQVFTVLTAGSITSTFSVRDLPSLNNGLVWNLSQTATSYALQVLRADYNENGIVDAGDYTVWRDNLNKSVTAYTGADGNGDGIVSQADYNLWRKNFGKRSAASVSGSGSQASLAVPEPTSAASLFWAAWIFGLACRRRKLACRF